MAPARSSTVAIAQRSPFLVRLTCSPVISPAIVTIEPSGLPPSSLVRAAIAVSAWADSTCSTPNSGWSETYRPSISRSKVSRVDLSHSTPGTAVSPIRSPPESPAESSPNAPNRLSCPMASWRLTATKASTYSSCTRSRPIRVSASPSNAPPLMSDSMVRLLHTTAGTFDMKSRKEVKRPFSSRAAMIASTTLWPTLRIACIPNRMSVPTAANWPMESLTSGGSTLMPMWRHSPR